MSRRDRLASVLRVRRIAEDRARAELAAARRTLEEREAEAARRRAAARRDGPAALRPAELLALHLSGIRAQELLAEARTAVDGATAVADEAHRALVRASVERRAAERLRERREEDAARLAQAAAQHSLDELATLRWGRQ